MQTKQDLVRFFSHHVALRDVFFGRKNYPNDSVFINTLFRRFTNPAMDTLLTETHHVFGDGSAMRDQFKSAFAHIKYYYPDFKEPKIETVITGMETDIFVSDSLVGILLIWKRIS